MKNNKLQMNKKTNTGYAIVDFAGKQFRVAEGQELKVPSTGGEPGGNVQLERVLLLNDGSETRFGDPTIAGASVDATILGHGRDRKIIVFKFRRRKGYRKKAGHRQGYSMLRINGINLAESKPPVKAEVGGKSTEAVAKTTGKAAAAKKTITPRKTAGKPAAPKKAATTKKSAGTGKATAPKKTTTASKSSGKTKGTTPKSAAKKKTSGS